MSTDLDNAMRLYRAFREEAPHRARGLRFAVPKAVAKIGIAEFVGYMTTHRGKLALYVHYFAPGSRPSIYANTGLGQLYYIGGRFRVTGRGLTDVDSRGRVVDFKPRFVVVDRKRFEQFEKWEKLTGGA